ncbi:type VII secretion system ESX-2 serine protease mycosin MycP2 [Mycobacterium avium subsp. paratuberculosis]|nr:type VII secretion system ESX-2 serine protease mycosin MycP2 [Mycobacterium avium subsp. paratuberculosis]
MRNPDVAQLAPGFNLLNIAKAWQYSTGNGVAGIGRGIGRIPCGAAPMMELTMVPWASQSDRPSSPMM